MKHPKVKTMEYVSFHFMEFVTKNGECWDWNAGYEKRWGYGRIKIQGKSEKAHRLSWRIFKGPIPKGMGVLHKCDRPICVNPDHLFLGTNMDNQHDCIVKKRKVVKRGQEHYLTTLTQSEVDEIKTLLSTTTNTELGRRYAVRHSVISDIRRGRTWKGKTP